MDSISSCLEDGSTPNPQKQGLAAMCKENRIPKADKRANMSQDSHDRFTAAAGASSSGDQHDATQGAEWRGIILSCFGSPGGAEPEVFPEALRVIGILRERIPGTKSSPLGV